MVYLPLWKIWVRQLGWLFLLYGKIKNVPVTTNQINYGHRGWGWLRQFVHQKAYAKIVLCRIELANWQCNGLDKDFATQKPSFLNVLFLCGYVQFFWASFLRVKSQALFFSCMAPNLGQRCKGSQLQQTTFPEVILVSSQHAEPCENHKYFKSTSTTSSPAR